MILVAHVLVHNDAWCIGASARAMLRYCDDMIIGLHASTDGTEDVLEDLSREHPGRVTVVEQDSCFPKEDLPIEQAGGVFRRGHLGKLAVRMGATHVLGVDSDEVVTANVAGQMRDLAQQGVVYLPWVSMWRSLDTYRETWRQMMPFAYPVDGKSHWIGSGHGRFPADVAALPYPPEPHVSYGTGGVMHLAYLSERRLMWKRLMYRIHERLWYPKADSAAINAKFSESIGRPSDDEMKPVSPSWWTGLEDVRGMLRPDDRLWHEDECRRLVAEHGMSVLDGLDLGGCAL